MQKYGRDVTHNDDSDGHAGFSFTKLNDNGNTLPASATEWSCVKDNVTGLIWEVKTNDGGLKDRDWKYTWYNSTGIYVDYAGTANGGRCFDNSNCDTEKYVQQVNSQGLCGATHWRMPTIKELENIRSLKLDRIGPRIDTNYFPNIGYRVYSRYWSATLDAVGANNAWSVDFANGSSSTSDRNDSEFVRLVRSSLQDSHDFIPV